MKFPTAQERLQWYRNAYEKENIPVRESLIYHAIIPFSGGVQGIEKLVCGQSDMNGRVCYHYAMNHGAVIGMMSWVLNPGTAVCDRL